jgi:hypothetical protein
MHPETKSILVQTILDLMSKTSRPRNTNKIPDSVQRNTSNSETGTPKQKGCNDVLMGASA